MAKTIKKETTEVKTNPIFIPEIPAQIIEKPVIVKAGEGKANDVFITEKPDTDEVIFLKQILHIQEVGGFGRHLHEFIKDRIKSLK